MVFSASEYDFASRFRRFVLGGFSPGYQWTVGPGCVLHRLSCQLSNGQQFWSFISVGRGTCSVAIGLGSPKYLRRPFRLLRKDCRTLQIDIFETGTRSHLGLFPLQLPLHQSEHQHSREPVHLSTVLPRTLHSSREVEVSSRGTNSRGATSGVEFGGLGLDDRRVAD